MEITFDFDIDEIAAMTKGRDAIDAMGGNASPALVNLAMQLDAMLESIAEQSEDEQFKHREG